MSKLNDLDLMLLADGESDAAPAGAHARTTTAADRQKIEGIREVGELVRGHLELAADEAEPRLAGLWDLVERRLDADERAEQVPVERAAPVKAAQPGLWSRVGGWFAGHRSQVFTGAVAAGAAAVITLMLRPAPETKIVTRDVIREVPVVQAPGPGPTQQFAAMPAEVESLEVNGGSGAVFTIAGEEGEGETTVIWVTPDDVLEGL